MPSGPSHFYAIEIGKGSGGGMTSSGGGSTWAQFWLQVSSAFWNILEERENEQIYRAHTSLGFILVVRVDEQRLKAQTNV